jgi:hypothetical protein
VSHGDLLLLNHGWYVTHAGLLRLARRKHCSGVGVSPVNKFCNPTSQHWAFKATVYKSRTCRGFVGYGDADPSNVSSLVRGAEMRVAETRAVNRALRKAYGIGVCSVEEIGTIPSPTEKLPPQGSNGKWQWIRSEGPRPPLPDHPRAQARSRTLSVLMSSKPQALS